MKDIEGIVLISINGKGNWDNLEGIRSKVDVLDLYNDIDEVSMDHKRIIKDYNVIVEMVW